MLQGKKENCNTDRLPYSSHHQGSFNQVSDEQPYEIAKLIEKVHSDADNIVPVASAASSCCGVENE